MDVYTLLYFKWITIKDLLYIIKKKKLSKRKQQGNEA